MVLFFLERSSLVHKQPLRIGGFSRLSRTSYRKKETSSRFPLLAGKAKTILGNAPLVAPRTGPNSHFVIRYGVYTCTYPLWCSRLLSTMQIQHYSSLPCRLVKAAREMVERWEGKAAGIGLELSGSLAPAVLLRPGLPSGSGYQ